MSQHTPGPWLYDSGSFYAAVQLNDNGMTHESPIIDMGDGRPENYEANVRLIGSAPRLLSALETMYAMFNGNGVTPEDDAAIDAARAAIAEATGVAP